MPEQRPQWEGLIPTLVGGQLGNTLVAKDGTIVIYDPKNDEFIEYDPQGNICVYHYAGKPPRLLRPKCSGGNGPPPKNPPGWYGPRNPLPNPPKTAQAMGLAPIRGPGRPIPGVAWAKETAAYARIPYPTYPWPSDGGQVSPYPPPSVNPPPPYRPERPSPQPTIDGLPPPIPGLVPPGPIDIPRVGLYRIGTLPDDPTLSPLPIMPYTPKTPGRPKAPPEPVEIFV
jgi:hypothetical protein